MGLYVYTYADLTCVYLTFIWICVVVSVIIVACSVFLFVYCLLNAFAICVGEVTVLSVRVIGMRCVALWLVCLCY